MFRLLPVLLLLCACGPGEQKLDVVFDAKVGAAAFRCGDTYAVGTAATPATFSDFRFYATGVTLTDARGKTAVTDVGLLDFCGATPRRTVTVTAPGDFTPVSLAFDVGFPEAKNHLDATLAKAPLDEPGMWWSWTGGFKFLRLDLKQPATWYVHLGASGCSGEPSKGFSCQSPNVAHVSGAWRSTTVVAVDVASLFTGTDVSRKPDNVVDFEPGCMSEPADPDCPKFLERLGLAGAPQAVFTLVTTAVK